MPTKHPRINLILEKPLFQTIKALSKQNDLSLSSQVRNLILNSLENIEDMSLVQLAEERSRTFDRRKALTHEEVWKGLSNRKK